MYRYVVCATRGGGSAWALRKERSSIEEVFSCPGTWRAAAAGASPFGVFRTPSLPPSRSRRAPSEGSAGRAHRRGACGIRKELPGVRVRRRRLRVPTHVLDQRPFALLSARSRCGRHARIDARGRSRGCARGFRGRSRSTRSAPSRSGPSSTTCSSAASRSW